MFGEERQDHITNVITGITGLQYLVIIFSLWQSPWRREPRTSRVGSILIHILSSYFNVYSTFHFSFSIFILCFNYFNNSSLFVFPPQFKVHEDKSFPYLTQPWMSHVWKRAWCRVGTKKALVYSMNAYWISSWWIKKLHGIVRIGWKLAQNFPIKLLTRFPVLPSI